MHILERKTFIPVDISRAWKFFSDPRNLTEITPKEMDFRIKTPLKPGEFYAGMKIEYTVSPLAGIPMRWVSEIREVEEGKRFQDVQLVGPYARWEHSHEFKQVNGGVEMRDLVVYSVPFGWFGRLLHRLFIRRKLEAIFSYREQKIKSLFA